MTDENTNDQNNRINITSGNFLVDPDHWLGNWKDVKRGKNHYIVSDPFPPYSMPTARALVADINRKNEKLNLAETSEFTGDYEVAVAKLMSSCASIHASKRSRGCSIIIIDCGRTRLNDILSMSGMPANFVFNKTDDPAIAAEVDAVTQGRIA